MWCFTILGEVNGRRPETDQISIWALRGRLHQVLRLHAELYPNSPNAQTDVGARNNGSNVSFRWLLRHCNTELSSLSRLDIRDA